MVQSKFLRAKFLRTVLIAFACIGITAGCASDQKRTRTGAAAGAVVGGVVGAATGGARGAAIGAAIGAAGGGGIGYYLDQRQKELARVVETRKTDNGLMVTLKNDLLFDFDRAELKDQSKTTLKELAAILAKYPQDELRITGFTDAIGSEAYNKKLSEDRAQSVKTYLAANGVAGARMETVGLGETNAKGNTDAERQADRKVEIFVDVEPPAQAKK